MEKKFPHVDKIFVDNSIAILVPQDEEDEGDGGEELEKPPQRRRDESEVERPGTSN